MELRRYGSEELLDVSSIQLKLESAMFEDELGSIDKRFPCDNPVTMCFD
jgi:hypothetical protein